ncbi:MAG: hypothetical protein J5802_14570 [Butyrivibrio sp.]|nr:hypothetical protein [Butyrivibrio sp.]
MKKIFADKKKLIIAVIIFELLLLIFNALRFNRSETYSFTQDDFLLKHYNYETREYDSEIGFYADHSTFEGAYIVTKPVKLKKGIYSVAVTYDTNSDGNWHTCYTTMEATYDISKNNSAHLVYSDHIAMPGTKNVVTYDSWVRYGTDFEVRMGPETDSTGDNIYVIAQDASITYLRGRTMVHETTKLFLLFLALDVLLFLIWIKKEETKSFLQEKALAVSVLLFTVLFASYPLLGSTLYFGDDIYYHLRRIAYTAEAIRYGQFPVHILPGWDNGYGYAAGVGYGDLLLYPSAIMVILGFTVQTAYKFYVFLTNTLAALTAYFAFGKISGDKKVGLASSVLFTLVGFRLHSVYSGATVGEFGAFTFLPLVILGLWGIYTKKDKKSYWYLAFGVTLTLSCHVLSAFILALVIPVFCLILIEKTLQKDILIPLLKGLAAIILLNLHFVVPLLDYMLFQNMKGNTVTTMLWGRARDFVTFFSYFQAEFLDTGGFLGLGIPCIAIFAIALAFIITGKFVDGSWVYFRVFVLSIIFVLLSTNSMFYYVLMQDAPVIYKLLANMQFPWHFLDVSCGMMVFWFAITMGDVVNKFRKETAGFIAMALICFACVIQADTLLGDVVKEANPITMYDEVGVSDPFSAEFSISGSNTDITLVETDMVIREDVGATAEMTGKKGTTVYAQVDNPTGEPVVTEAPLWAYRHYVAKAGGKKLKVSMAASKKLAVEIPAGYSGEIKIFFREPFLWRLSELISLATVIFALRMRNLRKRK